MNSLFILCFGISVLMWLSHNQNPAQLHDTQGYRRHFIRDEVDIYLIAAIIWMTCFAFLRTHYNDTTAYINSFRGAESVAQGILNGSYSDWMENPLSSVYRDFMRSITSNYHVYFFFPALLHSLAVLKLCKHYSVNPTLSILIFFAVGTYAMYLAAFKQNIAMSILLLAIPYAERKKYIRFLLMVAVATLFHFYAIVYLLVPFLFGRPWGKTTWILLGLTLFALSTYDATLGALMENVENLGGNIAEEELFDGNSINELRVAVYWVPGLLALIFRRYVTYDSTRMDNLFINLSIVCALVLTMGLAEGANLYARMAGYFEIGMAIALPYMLGKIFTRESERLVSVIAGMLFIGYFYYEFTFSKAFAAEYRAISLGQFFLELLGIQ